MFTVSFLYVVAATRQAETFDAAVALGREAGFSFVVLDAANEIVASWCPIGGLGRNRRARSAAPLAQLRATP